jgi:hypothetical protein
VDRSNLSIASCVTTLARPVPPPPPAPRPLVQRAVPLAALSGKLSLPQNGEVIPWRIDVGTVLVVDAGAEQETVEVRAVNATSKPPTITAAFAKPHAAGAAVSLANVPGAPPVLLKPLAVEGPEPTPMPPYVPQLPYSLTVRLAVDPASSNATTLAGWYDGIPWTVRAGSPLVIDSGANQEVVTVQRAGFAFDPKTATGSFRFVVTKPHGGSFQIAKTFLGNPGPQGRFNPRDQVYSAVVRYLSIVR